jgi:hypothetical protein
MMTKIQLIARRNYVASPSDVREFARELFTAQDVSANGNDNYLKILTANTQVELGAEPRQRSRGKPDKIEGEEVDRQLAALEEVHKRYWPEIKNAINGNAQEKRRRSIKFKTMKSTLSTYIRAGNDVLSLTPAQVSKNGLRKARSRTLKGAQAVIATERRVVRQADSIAAAALSIKDKQAASRMIESALSRLSAALTKLGASVTNDPETAIREGRLLRVPRVGTFVHMPSSDAPPRNGTPRLQ